MSAAPVPVASPYNRNNPFPMVLKTNQLLSGEGSENETRHIEFSLAGSGLHYEVGDSMAVFPLNDPVLVDEIIAALGVPAEVEVKTKKGSLSLREALIRDLSVTKVTKKFLQALAAKSISGGDAIRKLLEPEHKEALESYTEQREVIDCLLEHPEAKFEPQELVDVLSPMVVRLYSIASSLKAHPEEVHFTLAAVRYQTNGRQRKGVCSTFLSDRLPVGETTGCFVQTTKHFRLPENGDTPIIMVGPGTGIAPFRAFLEERQVLGQKGPSWLFFGAQREQLNFFYKEQFTAMQSEGYLTKLSTAFSRDAAPSISLPEWSNPPRPGKGLYVQHRLAEAGKEIWQWLQDGAHFFVCGDASRMAKDVDFALHKIAEDHGGLSPEAASEYVSALKKDHRYKRDVY